MVEAAIPECSAGTEPRAAEVTGTMAMPTPTPARNMVQPIWPIPDVGGDHGVGEEDADPASRHPVAIGMRGPHAATQRPVSTRRATMPTASGTKSSARANGETPDHTWRYSATMKKMAKVPK